MKVNKKLLAGLLSLSVLLEACANNTEKGTNNTDTKQTEEAKQNEKIKKLKKKKPMKQSLQL